MTADVAELAQRLALVPPGWKPPTVENWTQHAAWGQQVPCPDLGLTRFHPRDTHGPVALEVVASVARGATGAWGVEDCFGQVPGHFEAFRSLRAEFISTGRYLGYQDLGPTRNPLPGALADLGNALSRATHLDSGSMHAEGLREWERAVVSAYLGEALSTGLPSEAGSIEELSMSVGLPGMNSWGQLAGKAASFAGNLG